MSYTLSEIHPDDHRGMAQVRNLLEQEGIRRDGNLDYTCGIFNDDWELAATGSCFGNTIRCLAVSGRHRGEGLLNQIVSHLVEVQLARGSAHLFLYTKPDSAQYLSDLGFYEIVRVPDSLVFMENRRGVPVPKAPGGAVHRRRGDERQPLHPGAPASGGAGGP